MTARNFKDFLVEKADDADHWWLNIWIVDRYKEYLAAK